MAQVPISIELRFLRVPAKWRLAESQYGLTLVPEIDQNVDRHLEFCDEPWKLRDEFLRLKHTEEASLEFLERIGVWKAVEDRKSPASPMSMAGEFGHRLFFGRALPITLEELWRYQSYWKDLLSNEDRLRAEFSPPPKESAAPFEKTDFALKSAFINTLPLHIDWQLKRRRSPDGGQTQAAVEPSGIVQPITGWELLVSTTHIDLLRKAGFQICQRPDCGIPFTGRRKPYCCWYCGHIESVRRKRKEKKADAKRR